MEAPRGAREPTGTNGPTPHQPPPTRHPTPQTVSAPQQGGPRGRQPQTPNRGQHGRGRQPDTPRRARKHGPKHGNKGGARKSRNHYTNHDQPTPHPTHHTTAAGQDTPPHSGPTKGGGRTTQSCGGHSTGETPSNIPNLEAKPGRANGTAPQGVWESRKPPQHTRGGPRTQARPPHTHPRDHARQTSTRARPRNNAGTHPRDHAGTHARHQRGPNTDHANTRARTGAHEPHPRATTRTRASYCARPPSGLRLFMFQQSSGR